MREQEDRAGALFQSPCISDCFALGTLSVILASCLFVCCAERSLRAPDVCALHALAQSFHRYVSSARQCETRVRNRCHSNSGLPSGRIFKLTSGSELDVIEYTYSWVTRSCPRGSYWHH